MVSPRGLLDDYAGRRAARGGFARDFSPDLGADIAEGLRNIEGITIDRRLIELPNPIRSVGTFMVPVKVASRLEPKITVNVIDEAANEAAVEESVTAE